MPAFLPSHSLILLCPPACCWSAQCDWAHAQQPRKTNGWRKVLTDLSDHKLWGMVCPRGLWSDDERLRLCREERRDCRNGWWQQLKIWWRWIICINTLTWKDDFVSRWNSGRTVWLEGSWLFAYFWAFRNRFYRTCLIFCPSISWRLLTMK